MNKILKKLSVLLVFLLLFSSSNIYASTNRIINTDVISDQDIQESVHHFITLDKDFFGYNVETLSISNFKQPYYDADNNIIAYSVIISDKQTKLDIGYVLVGATYDMPAIIEAGKGAPPSDSLNEVENNIKSKLLADESISAKTLLYGGPFAYYVKFDIKNKDNTKKYILADLKSKMISKENVDINFLKKPKIKDEEKLKLNKTWKNYSKNKNIVSTNKDQFIKTAYADTQPSPPTYGYTSISFSLNSDNIQYSKGWPYYLYGCGPAAGTLLIYHLGQRNSNFSNLLKDSNGNSMTTTQIFGELLNDMDAIGGTQSIEFGNGISLYGSEHGWYNLATPYSYIGTSLGGGSNTTSNYDVWSTLKYGINTYNAPVALGIGNKTTSGSSYYIEGNIPSGYEYHWVTVSGYIEDENYNMYFKSKSWGSDYYTSFNSLCYWRDALVSKYINESY